MSVVATTARGGSRLPFIFLEAGRQLNVVVELVVTVLVEVTVEGITILFPVTVEVPPLLTVTVDVEVIFFDGGVEVWTFVVVIVLVRVAVD